MSSDGIREYGNSTRPTRMYVRREEGRAAVRSRAGTNQHTNRKLGITIWRKGCRYLASCSSEGMVDLRAKFTPQLHDTLRKPILSIHSFCTS